MSIQVTLQQLNEALTAERNVVEHVRAAAAVHVGLARDPHRQTVGVSVDSGGSVRLPYHEVTRAAIAQLLERVAQLAEARRAVDALVAELLGGAA